MDKVAEFARSVGIMKPSSAKKDNPKELAKLDKLLDSDDYVAEEKLDGAHYKMIGHRFFSTENVEKTHNFPHLSDFFKALKMHNLVLDGEIHYPGKTSQDAVKVTGSLPDQAVSNQERDGYIHYTIFDLLRTPKARWTINNTYMERRKMVEYFYNRFIKGTEMEDYIHIAEMRQTGKREYMESLLAQGLEGVVLKKKSSLYQMGKKPKWEWMKVKQHDSTDLVVIGFEPPKKEYTGKSTSSWKFWEDDMPVTEAHYHGWIGSVILGAYVDGELTKICTAAGLKREVQIDMTENPEDYIGRVARVDFMEKTSDGFPRHPVFVNMHEGKAPEECEWEFE